MRGRWLGGAILVSLGLHAVSKGRALLPEMLWACYVASAILAAGILLRRPRLAAIGWLFEVALGLPSYLLDVAATGTTTPTSFLAHLAPASAGFLELRSSGLPRGIVLPAWLLYPVMIAVSRWATDPALNVNLAHAPWAPSAWAFPRLWMYWSFNAATALALLLGVDFLLRRWLGRRAPPTAGRRSPGE